MMMPTVSESVQKDGGVFRELVCDSTHERQDRGDVLVVYDGVCELVRNRKNTTEKLAPGCTWRFS